VIVVSNGVVKSGSDSADKDKSTSNYTISWESSKPAENDVDETKFKQITAGKIMTKTNSVVNNR
jgi:hypothetical protein